MRVSLRDRTIAGGPNVGPKRLVALETQHVTKQKILKNLEFEIFLGGTNNPEKNKVTAFSRDFFLSGNNFF